ncbi:hypothetical protein TWF730_001838 [Orbilia blumenaviensis]|uniref:Uncharacterized protein n=1 Tax=Orbilia blumenaviensis TaxID=1796055 RepID=A0AAV9UGK6_9PEZI
MKLKRTVKRMLCCCAASSDVKEEAPRPAKNLNTDGAADSNIDKDGPGNDNGRKYLGKRKPRTVKSDNGSTKDLGHLPQNQLLPEFDFQTSPSDFSLGLEAGHGESAKNPDNNELADIISDSEGLTNASQETLHGSMSSNTILSTSSEVKAAECASDDEHLLPIPTIPTPSDIQFAGFVQMKPFKGIPSHCHKTTPSTPKKPFPYLRQKPRWTNQRDSNLRRPQFSDIPRPRPANCDPVFVRECCVRPVKSPRPAYQTAGFPKFIAF